MIAGVCTGLGRYTSIDPVIFRVGFALLVMAGGQGILLYVAAALLMPADPAGMSPGEQVLRRRFDGDTVLVILGALLGLGVLISATGGGLSGDALIVVTIFALVLLVAHARDVNLLDVARSLPGRLQGQPPESSVPPEPARPDTTTGDMVDLATLGTYRPSAPPTPAPPPAPSPPQIPRPRSVLTPVTLLLAMIAGAAVLPAVAGRSAHSVVQVTMATGLAVVGLGLVVASAFGRGRGLVMVGTLLSLGLLATSLAALAPAPGRFGDVAWRPVDATRTEQTYRVTVGDGTLDLTALPLRPGQHIRVNAELVMGRLRVTVPPGSRVDAHLTARVGDVTLDKRLISGPNATLNEVLEPATRTKNPPTIELHVSTKLGDVEVTRA
jgi:phage shock protein PspC (stress-responsive transcriptional regulator)